MRISISKIDTVQGETWFKVTNYENCGAEIVAVSLAELVCNVLDHAGFAASLDSCRELIGENTTV